jgi:hypothetical protein
MYIHGRPEGSDISRYESLKQVEKTTGKTPPELLSTPTLSEELTACWDAYVKLETHSYTEIDAYIRLTGLELEPWEVEAIMALSKFQGVTATWPPK